MQKRTFILALVLLVASSVLLSGCVKTETTAPTVEKPVVKEVIKIGWLGPLTGDVSTIGQACKDAAKLAADEINAAGGINGQQVELVFEDGNCNAKTSNTAGNKMINTDKVMAIVGGFCSSETQAVAPIAEQAKVIMLSPASTAPAITAAGDYIFRDVPSDAYQGKFAAEFAFNKMLKKKVAILYTKSDYTEAIANVFATEFEKLGGKVELKESFLQDSRDLKTEMTKVKKSGAELLYFATYTEAGVVGLKQAKEIDIGMKILAPETFTDPKIVAADGADGVILTSPKSETNEAFKSKFLAVTKRTDIPVYVTQTYDAVNILAEAMKKAGSTDPEKVKVELYKITAYNGVSGTIGFDANGDLSKAEYEVKMINKGKLIDYPL